MLPAGLTLALLAGATIVVAVLGGGALSAILCGHRPALAGPGAVVGVIGTLITHPAHPAAAWPHDPRPGPAWLTWPCILLVAIGWSAGVSIIGSAVHGRLGRRRDEGLASVQDIRRTGLDARSAVRKAIHEYPNLVAQHRIPRTQHRRRWMR
ncbi:hypothetical protein [Nocardia alni]|uniref:hypothetical protein n=1 Tax=Nocardia alni TaxID=2815723 RepID=UPI001C242936|nr:hypothetical protein [Nocardia alni]